ncbi:hypothetical protein L7F22_056881, partial [Adiantum nelumboides]|nr:hypothetical protein [Adiantum nelumboides]
IQRRYDKRGRMNLVAVAICSGIFNDLGNDSNVDLCIITKGGVEFLRNYKQPNPQTYVSKRGYSFGKGHTTIPSTKVFSLREQVTVMEGNAMVEE